jgi:hypothetical protein
MLWVLLVFEEDDTGGTDELREIIGPFESQYAASIHREKVSADKFETMVLTAPGTPTT